MRAFFASAAVALVVGLPAGCSKPSPPVVAAERATVTRVDAAGIALDLSIRVTNPNAIDLTATGVSPHVVVDRVDVGTISVPRVVTLPAGAAVTLDVPVALGWPDVSALARLAATTGSIPYSVDGSVEVGGVLRVAVPFHLAGALSREQIAAAFLRPAP